jgi:hypothetical protein
MRTERFWNSEFSRGEGGIKRSGKSDPSSSQKNGTSVFAFGYAATRCRGTDAEGVILKSEVGMRPPARRGWAYAPEGSRK